MATNDAAKKLLLLQARLERRVEHLDKDRSELAKDRKQFVKERIEFIKAVSELREIMEFGLAPLRMLLDGVAYARSDINALRREIAGLRRRSTPSPTRDELKKFRRQLPS